MNREQFYVALRKRIREVQRKRIWDRASCIVEELGARKSEVHDWWTSLSYSLAITIDGVRLQIDKYNGPMSGMDLWINADGRRVFSAREVSLNDSRSSLEAARMFEAPNREGIGVLVEIYEPGIWEKALNIQKARVVFRAQERQKRTRENAERSDSPLSEQEKDTARSLALHGGEKL